MVIGSGPIIIGQAAEFDYAGRKLVFRLEKKVWKWSLLTATLQQS